MKGRYLIILLLVTGVVNAQTDSLLIKQSMLFHQKLILNDEVLTNYLDENLTYGHSSGWIETKQAMLDNLKSDRMKYIAIKEDSLTSSVDKKLGWVRFFAEVTAVLDGKQSNIRLKVLEIWRKKSGVWKLYARQAVKA
ncbi:nuclear transport factor 2 family protein [soil metagenome]